MAEFNDRYVSKLKKDLAQNDVEVNALWYVTLPNTVLLDVVWILEGQKVAAANAYLNLETKIGNLVNFSVEDSFQNRGTLTSYVSHIILEWPKRGVDSVVASPLNGLDAAILCSVGFTPPAHSLDYFNLDLKSDRAKEFRAYVTGGEEPEWYPDAKVQINTQKNLRNLKG